MWVRNTRILVEPRKQSNPRTNIVPRNKGSKKLSSS
jgi:hypothetical protein